MAETVNSAANADIPPFRCPICDSSLNTPVLVWETSPLGTVGIRRCPECGLYFTYPRLDDPQGHYHESNLQKWEAKYGAIDRGERLHDRHENYLEEARTIEQYVASGTILDVGCNSGWLLGYLQKSPRQYVLEGLEPSAFQADIARRRLGITVHTSYLEALTERDNYYAGIVATDVIEHVLPEDIGGFIDAAVRLLAPGGYLFLKTPNVRFTILKSRITRRLLEVIRHYVVRHDDVWDAKEHVIHWDVRNLSRILEQHGLTVIHTFTPRPVQTYNSPRGAYAARSAIRFVARLLGGQQRVLFFAQDMFLIVQKSP